MIKILEDILTHEFVLDWPFNRAVLHAVESLFQSFRSFDRSLDMVSKCIMTNK